MRHCLHKSTTHTLGAPLDWDQDRLPCDPLPVTMTTLNNVPTIKSYWRPTHEELMQIINGEYITISIVGETMPPICLQVEK